MRFILLAPILASLPLFIAMLKQNRHQRPYAFAAMVFMLFLGNAVRVEGYLISWPMWTGVSKGIGISPVDTLAIALIATRFNIPGKIPFWGLFALYGTFLVFSLAMSVVPMASFFMVWQYARILLIFAAVAGECHRREIRSGLLTGLALGMILQVGYVAQQKASGVVQAMGTMSHQNVLGLMTELSMIPLLAAMLGGDRRKIILFGVGAAAVVIAGGGSRGTMGFAGGGAAILILLSLIRGVTPAKMRVVGFAALGLVIAAPIGFITLKDRFGSTSMTTQDDQRPAFERSARAMAADHPFGVGANMYVTTANLKGYADRAGVAWNFSNRSAPVHNAYLLARAETGWLGEIAYILLLTVPMLAGLRVAFKNRSAASGDLALGSAVALGTNIVHNNYEFASFSFTVFALLCVNLGFIASEMRASRLPSTRPRHHGSSPDPQRSLSPVKA